MDPIRNLYAPGAGTHPPEMVGRDDIRETARSALARIRLGRPSKSIGMVGLRGVGKTVLLDQISEDAEANNVLALRIEAPEQRSLPSMITPQLRFAHGVRRLITPVIPPTSGSQKASNEPAGFSESR